MHCGWDTTVAEEKKRFNIKRMSFFTIPLKPRIRIQKRNFWWRFKPSTTYIFYGDQEPAQKLVDPIETTFNITKTVTEKISPETTLNFPTVEHLMPKFTKPAVEFPDMDEQMDMAQEFTFNSLQNDSIKHVLYKDQTFVKPTQFIKNPYLESNLVGSDQWSWYGWIKTWLGEETTNENIAKEAIEVIEETLVDIQRDNVLRGKPDLNNSGENFSGAEQIESTMGDLDQTWSPMKWFKSEKIDQNQMENLPEQITVERNGHWFGKDESVLNEEMFDSVSVPTLVDSSDRKTFFTWSGKKDNVEVEQAEPSSFISWLDTKYKIVPEQKPLFSSKSTDIKGTEYIHKLSTAELHSSEPLYTQSTGLETNAPSSIAEAMQRLERTIFDLTNNLKTMIPNDTSDLKMVISPSVRQRIPTDSENTNGPLESLTGITGDKLRSDSGSLKESLTSGDSGNESFTSEDSLTSIIGSTEESYSFEKTREGLTSSFGKVRDSLIDSIENMRDFGNVPVEILDQNGVEDVANTMAEWLIFLAFLPFLWRLFVSAKTNDQLKLAKSKKK
jgi:hypothetical protein